MIDYGSIQARHKEFEWCATSDLAMDMT
jgi:hypothetical protein